VSCRAVVTVIVFPETEATFSNSLLQPDTSQPVSWPGAGIGGIVFAALADVM